jgi:internalin A
LPNSQALDLANTPVSEIKALGALKRLRFLNLYGTTIKAESLAILVGRHLEGLQLPESACTDTGLRWWLAALSPEALRQLDLCSWRVTDAVLGKLAELPHLRRLSLANTQITDAGLSSLSSLKELSYLNLYKTQITDKALPFLSTLPQLRGLNLSQTQVTDRGLKMLAARRLHYLRLPAAARTDLGLHFWLAAWVPEETERLTFYGRPSPDEPEREYWQITDRALKELGQQNHLRRLTLIECPQVTDAGLRHLVQASGLEELSLYQVEITDKGLKYLKALKQLRRLVLEDVPITGSGLAGLEGMRLWELYIPHHLCIERNLKPYLAALAREIISLNLGDWHLTAEGLQALTSWKHLRGLTVGGQGITDQALAVLSSSLPQLEELSLLAPEITDAGLGFLPKLRHLRRLVLREVRIRGAGLSQLAALPRLEALDLYGSAVRDQDLPVLLRMPHIQNWGLRGTKITDEGLKVLARLRSLRWLDLRGCKGVSAAGVQVLQTALPETTIMGPE